MAIVFQTEAKYVDVHATPFHEDHVITLPSFSTNEIVIMATMISGLADEPLAFTAGVTGWTPITDRMSNGATSVGTARLWYRVMQAGDGTTTTITLDNGGFFGSLVVLTVCYSGNAVNSPIDGHVISNGTSQNPVSPTYTTTSTNCMIMRYCDNDDFQNMPPGAAFPAGVTDRGSEDIDDVGAGAGGFIGIGDEGVQSAAEATGTATWTSNTSNEYWQTVTIAIRDIANDITPISNTLTCLYDLRTSIANTLEGLYDMAGRVSNTLTGLYDMREFTSNTLTGLYDIREFVSNTLTGLYDLRTSISNTITGRYDIRVLATNILTGLYDMQGRVSNTLTGLYDMQGRVSNTLTGLYDLRTSISNTITGVFDIRELVSNTLTGLYNIKEFVSNTLTGLYDIRELVSNTLTGVYDMVGRVSNTLTGIYRIYNIYKQTGSKGSKATTGSKGAKATTGGKSAR